MTLVGAHKLQAVWQAEASALAVVQLGGLPLDDHPVLELLHRLRVVSVDAALEVTPQILDWAEVAAVGWKVECGNAVVVEPGATGSGGVWGGVVLLVVPEALRPEGVR